MKTRNLGEKNMFGGIGFLLNGNMCLGVWQESLIVRVGPARYAEALRKPFAGIFDMTGRAMTGWVLVDPEGLAEDHQLADWIQPALEFVRTLPPK